MQTLDRYIFGAVTVLIGLIAVVLIAGDHSGVGIREVAPADSSHPPSTLPIRITFAEPMRRESVEDHFSVKPSIAGKTSWAGNTFVFAPTPAFDAGRNYTVTISAGAVSASGKILQKDRIWSFIPREPIVYYLAPANASIRALWSIEPMTGETHEVYAPEYGVYNFATSRGAQHIAVTEHNADGTSAISIIDLTGQNRRVLPECDSGSCGGPAWSPDGKFLAYEKQEALVTGSPGSNRVWLYELSTDTTTPLFEDDQILGFSPNWSADGQKLAFFDANSHAIRVLDMATGSVLLASSQSGEVGTFSPDGSHLVYTDIRLVGRQFFSELWLADLDSSGGIQPLLANSSEEDQSPKWSPDGQWIAFARHRLDRAAGLGSQLFLVDPVTLEIHSLTDDNQYNNTRFVWSPTGQQILLQRFDFHAASGEQELWILDIAHDTQTLLVRNAFQGEWVP